MQKILLKSAFNIHVLCLNGEAKPVSRLRISLSAALCLLVDRKLEFQVGYNCIIVRIQNNSCIQ